MPHYAVRRGHRPGVYTSWPKCDEQTRGFPGAEFKKFATPEEAEAWLEEPPMPAAATAKAALEQDGLERLAVARAVGRHIVYVDGSCKAQPRLSSWGLVAETMQTVVHTDSGVLTGPLDRLKMNNVYGEIVGALEALNLLEGVRVGTRVPPVEPPKFDRILLVHDLELTSLWARGLQNAKHPWVREVYMRHMAKHLDRVDFLWVRGHTGVVGNHLADELAGAAIQAHLLTAGSGGQHP